MSNGTLTPSDIRELFTGRRDSYLIKGIPVIDVYPNQLEQGDVIVTVVGFNRVLKTGVDKVVQNACSKRNCTHVNDKDCYDGTAMVAVAL